MAINSGHNYFSHHQQAEHLSCVMQQHFPMALEFPAAPPCCQQDGGILFPHSQGISLYWIQLQADPRRSLGAVWVFPSGISTTGRALGLFPPWTDPGVWIPRGNVSLSSGIGAGLGTGAGLGLGPVWDWGWFGIPGSCRGLGFVLEKFSGRNLSPNPPFISESPNLQHLSGHGECDLGL